MKFQLRMIGSGSAFAKAYYNNNALVACNGYTLMIDCGILAPMALHKMNFPMNDIQGVLVTHLHADHIGGLEEYALRMKYMYQLRPSLYIEENLIEPLWDDSLKAGLRYTVEGESTLRDFFDVVPLKCDVRQEIQPGLSVELIRTKHFPNMPSYSVVLNDKVFYSGDMTFNRALLDEMFVRRQCVQVLHDCQLEGNGLVHSTLNELLSLPEEYQERILLMHYGDSMPDYMGKTGKMTFIEQHKPYEFLAAP
ncbi:MBL fold metallo-hydrolase [Paenibacillus koleovorans]|uniref:MBL fold metallo-hydrolase n=1 Tax=Paenibacillus koleovorans TaxID=121608 RepID=UPI000FD732D7|nr:MBL fold metallo-hydrolase [Paenibacillus koleovorans]